MSRAKVVPPFRFAIAEVEVYRGAYPTLKNFSFLKSLGLKTIISLIPEQPTEDLSDFCVSENIDHIHKMVEKRKEDVTVSIKDVAEVVSIIIRRSKLPVYIHCLDGSETTGLVICCLRRLQAWHPECVVNEFCRFSRSAEMSKDEEKFVKSFKEVEIAEDDPPDWLWKAKLPVEPHPSIKLIKHSEGGVVQVVRPATQATRKDTKQVTSSLPLSAAMKRTKKHLAANPSSSSSSSNARRGDETTPDASTEEEAAAVRVQQQRTQQRERATRDPALAAAGGSRTDGPSLSGSPDPPSRLCWYEALSLHNFSDISKHGSGGPRPRDGL